MAKTISSKTADQLLHSFEQMCDHVENGLTPNNAAIKVAKEASLMPAQIELVCRSYNAGAINATRRNGETFLEKHAAVPKAEPAAVIREVFPTRLKTASAVVADVYRVIPETAYRTAKVAKEQKPSTEKLAQAKYDGRREQLRRERKQTTYEKAAGLRDELREVRAQVRRLEVDAVNKVAAVVDVLPPSKAMDPQYLRSVRAIAGEFYGKTGELLVDRTANIRLPSHRKADYFADLQTFVGQQVKLAYDRSQPIFVAIKAAKEGLEKLSVARKSALFHGLRLRRDIEQTLQPEVPLEKTAAILPPGTTAETLRQERWDKAANILSGMVGATASRLWSGEDDSSRAKGVDPKLVGLRLELNDPRHDNELRRIRSESLINSLLTKDDVIASYSPEEITSAVQELEDSAPGLLENPMLARANIRRQLQGNLTPLEATSVIESEQTLANTSPKDTMDKLKYLEGAPK